MTANAPRSIVVDSGPLIGAIFEEDHYHQEATRGIRTLAMTGMQVLAPLPVVFEVYKRLAYDVGSRLARHGLAVIRESFTVVYFDPDDLDNLQELIESMPWWGGSLEDATVAMLALERDVPVWTFNYRDLKAFTNLEFWTPG